MKLPVCLSICIFFACTISVWAAEEIHNHADFRQRVRDRALLAVYFYGKLCDSNCEDDGEYLESIAESFPRMEFILAPNLLHESSLLKQSPGLILYRNQKPIIYNGNIYEAHEVENFLRENQQTFAKSLNDENFEHLTQAGTGATTGDWFVMFYRSSQCEELLPLWDSLAAELHSSLNFAVVDLSEATELRDRFDVTACPDMILFHHGKYFRYNLNKVDLSSLVSFARGWYKNVGAIKVPAEKTPFDKIVGSIVSHLKIIVAKPNFLGMIGLGLGSTCALLLFLCCCCRSKNKEKCD